ncbi:hypothetical protein [Thermosulfurimonas sp.]|uniref:hypothetical protein n=1 Tax=Thermosulfurimonas sp. TaxID=2080236 RepID=UPI0025ECBD0B|nr:hypothetical protein [Thermosulfurimonas sp.]
MKYQEEVPLSGGCRHPHDYCPHRSGCMLYLIWKEEHRGREGENRGEDPSHQR